MSNISKAVSSNDIIDYASRASDKELKAYMDGFDAALLRIYEVNTRTRMPLEGELEDAKKKDIRYQNYEREIDRRADPYFPFP